MWWTVDGKTLDKLGDQRFSQNNSQVKYDYGDRTMENVLLIQDFLSEDLNKEFNCSVRNEKGFETRRAQLQEEGEEPRSRR
ncbi:interleukin-1 receptor accessory protein-like [Stegastes partitus]|nr:PREDICTED: interleukin-1 receptor accessory protein-like [Stegastes partitus]